MAAPMQRPVDPVYIDFAKDKAHAELEVKRLCQRVLPGWSSVAVEEMQVRVRGRERRTDAALASLASRSAARSK